MDLPVGIPAVCAFIGNHYPKGLLLDFITGLRSHSFHEMNNGWGSAGLVLVPTQFQCSYHGDGGGFVSGPAVKACSPPACLRPRFGWTADRIAAIPRLTADVKCGKGKTGVVTWPTSEEQKFGAFCFDASGAAELRSLLVPQLFYSWNLSLIPILYI